MSEYDRLVDILNKLCRYCTVCAKELKLVTAQATIKNSGAQNGTVSWYYKTCPDGHGSFGVDHRWDPHDGYPDAVFEVNPELFDLEKFNQLPFFDQLREVQAIVDEANKKVEE